MLIFQSWRIMRTRKINIGDTVTVIDRGNEIRERVIRLEYYPYQSDDTVISVGRVKRICFSILNK